jgi:hypothetical protein
MNPMTRRGAAKFVKMKNSHVHSFFVKRINIYFLY